MVRFIWNKDTGKLVATGLVPNFPTRESYTTPYEGYNVRPPAIESDEVAEVEDLEHQDNILMHNGLRPWGSFYGIRVPDGH